MFVRPYCLISNFWLRFKTVPPRTLMSTQTVRADLSQICIYTTWRYLLLWIEPNQFLLQLSWLVFALTRNITEKWKYYHNIEIISWCSCEMAKRHICSSPHRYLTCVINLSYIRSIEEFLKVNNTLFSQEFFGGVKTGTMPRQFTYLISWLIFVLKPCNKKYKLKSNRTEVTLPKTWLKFKLNK